MTKAAELRASDTVLEVGPGMGELTFELARHAGRVIAVEKDERLTEALGTAIKRARITNIEIIRGDALKLVRSLAPDKVVSNIPYYLTSRLIRVLLENEPRPQIIIFTIQKEVAQKIVAKPPKMNLLALSVQVFGKPEIIKKVPAECFSPKPAVESAIIKIGAISDEFFKKHGLGPEDFFPIARAVFSKRRKTMLHTLSKLIKKPAAEAVLKDSGIPPNSRPQELTPDQWAKIIIAITKTRGLASCF